MIVISRRSLVVLVAAMVLVSVVVGVVLLPAPRETVARIFGPVVTADPATLAAQRTVTERSVQRGYAKAIGQLDQVRQLRLAIPPGEAEAIDAKARTDLRDLRRQALVAVAGRTGIASTQTDQYIAAAQAELDRGAFEAEPGVLLAPALLDVVRRANALFQQVSDDAIRALTRAPGSPSPRASPSR